jgi:hypothetical protein
MMMQAANVVHEGCFQRFLLRSLEVLKRELPAGYADVASRLGRRAVKIEVDGERLCLVGNGVELSLAPTPLHPAASARGTSGALRAILEGSHTLDSAILADTITLQGRLPQLAAFYETLHAYFNAAVRCPSFAQLLDDYFESTSAPPEHPRELAHHAE